jgi:hypothetical protein
MLSVISEKLYGNKRWRAIYLNYFSANKGGKIWKHFLGGRRNRRNLSKR